MAIPTSDMPGHKELHDRVYNALDRCQESRSVDFKESAPWNDLKWQIIRAALAMGNLRDGGIIVIGASERDDTWDLTGISSEHIATYDVDDIIDAINKFASPPIKVEVVTVSYRSKNTFLAIQIHEFADSPFAEKNYHLDGFISSQWNELEQHLKNAFIITIFGYGAPQSDVSAIDLMKSAWGDVNKREMEQTEIIDIRSEGDLYKNWEPFIHTHHYDTHSSFYNSWIANHPRRTGEAHLSQYYDAQFIENNPIPKDFHFPELWSWFDKFKIVEEKRDDT